MTENDESEPVRVRRRKSRSARSRSSAPHLRDELATLAKDKSRLSQTIMRLLVGATGAYLLTVGYQVRLAAILLGGVVIGSRPADVTYIMGKPDRIEGAAGSLWSYGTPERSYSVFFDRGLAARIECDSQVAEAAACPPTLGLGVGSSEEQILARLGMPTSERYEGEDKFMNYRDVGLEFRLRQFVVYGVSLSKRESRFSYFPRIIRVALPTSL